jgi:hypothetical protein
MTVIREAFRQTRYCGLIGGGKISSFVRRKGEIF